MTINRSNLPHPAFGGTVAAMTYNPLVLPGKPEVRGVHKIKGGQGVLRAGTILGAITQAGADYGKLVISAAGAGDGSQEPFAILPEDLDTNANSNADKIYSVYVEGTFNETALVYGTGHTADSVRVPLRKYGIILDVARYSYV